MRPMLVAAAVFCGLWWALAPTAVGGGGDIKLRSLARNTAVAGKVTYSASRAMEKMTREDEYFMGRAAAAAILSRYPVYDNDDATRYLNLVGRSLTVASDLPEVFAGYRFIVLDSDEINAFATPGAFIFVSRGLLRLTRDEDMLAAVLAHEIAHIQAHDARHLIKEKRWKRFWKDALTAYFVSLTPKVLGDLSSMLGSMGGEIFSAIHEKGYARDQDLKADKAAVKLLQKVGYDSSALVDVLTAIDAVGGPRGRRFIRTHAKPKERIKAIKALVSGDQQRPEARQDRFEAALRQAREG